MLKTKVKMEITLRDGKLFLFAESVNTETHEDAQTFLKILQEIKIRNYQLEIGVFSDYALIGKSKSS